MVDGVGVREECEERPKCCDRVCEVGITSIEPEYIPHSLHSSPGRCRSGFPWLQMPFSARFRVLPLCAAPISGRCVVISSLHTLRTSLGTVRPHRSVPDAVSVPVLASASRASGTFTPRRCRRGPRCARTRSEGRRQGRVQHIVPRINSDPGCSTPAARRNEVRLRPSEVANRGERGSQARDHAMVSAARGAGC